MFMQKEKHCFGIRENSFEAFKLLGILCFELIQDLYFCKRVKLYTFLLVFKGSCCNCQQIYILDCFFCYLFLSIFGLIMVVS